jgi:CBS domain containing-hemolysin-like protein
MLTLGIVITLLLSALFSGSEIAYVSANKLKVELKKKRGGARGAIIADFYNHPSRFLSTMLVGNNIVLVLFTSLMAVPVDALLINRFGIAGEGLVLLLSTIIITVVVLIFGEFVPKVLFRVYADEALYLLAVPLKMFQLLLLPPTWLLTSASNGLLRLFFKQNMTPETQEFTRTDLEHFVKNARTEQEEEIDKEMFGKALNLRDVRVRECMVPRTEIETIDVNATVEELEALFVETKLSRLLIIDNDINQTLGYVHHQQLFERPQSIRELILDITFVPEVMRVSDLMQNFIAERNNIACVVDEFGSVSGLITLEDILEEIFGEIDDEYDEEEYVEEPLAENAFRFSARLEINYLNNKYNLNFPEGEYHTLSGYLVTATGQIPTEGDVIEIDGFRFSLESVTSTRIETVKVEVLAS